VISLALAQQLQAEEEHRARRDHDLYLREQEKKKLAAAQKQQPPKKEKKEKKKGDCVIM